MQAPRGASKESTDTSVREGDAGSFRAGVDSGAERVQVGTLRETKALCAEK